AAGPCIHDGRRDHCTPHDVRTSPGGQYAIGVSSRNAVVVDTQANKVVAAPAIGGLEFPNYALAVDPSTNELWLESKGSEFNWLNSMSQLPPFNILTSTYSTKSYFPYSAAFSPTGQGFGSFFGAEQDKITSFPPSPNELKIKVDRKTGPIVYVP
ncbi:MAG TPA: hypothetical protein VEV38_08520, partial [Candidatus Eremiobacteraceae bacterium]|nr:hypothetical protein [Candidatus Eremiobacteraceae bacterium]